MKLNNHELFAITGGALNASLLNSIARLITVAIEVGKMIGSAFRRVTNKNYC